MIFGEMDCMKLEQNMDTIEVCNFVLISIFIMHFTQIILASQCLSSIYRTYKDNISLFLQALLIGLGPYVQIGKTLEKLCRLFFSSFPFVNSKKMKNFIRQQNLMKTIFEMCGEYNFLIIMEAGGLLMLAILIMQHYVLVQVQLTENIMKLSTLQNN